VKLRLFRWEYDVRKGDVVLALAVLAWLGVIAFIYWMVLGLYESLG
jgi:hypothetical protein